MRQRLDKYQLAGLDDRERGFSRVVEIEQAEEGFRAVLKYETTHVATDPHSRQDLALLNLIETLQSQGYRQLKTQMSFRDGIYLGSQELWIEYQDPAQPEQTSSGLIAKLLNWLRPHAANE
jgi:hypothetical protein